MPGLRSYVMVPVIAVAMTGISMPKRAPQRAGNFAGPRRPINISAFGYPPRACPVKCGPPIAGTIATGHVTVAAPATISYTASSHVEDRDRRSMKVSFVVVINGVLSQRNCDRQTTVAPGRSAVLTCTGITRLRERGRYEILAVGSASSTLGSVDAVAGHTHGHWETERNAATP